MSYLWWFFVNWILNIVFIEVLGTFKGLDTKYIKIDAQYPAFKRSEYDKSLHRRMYMWPTCHFAIIKIVGVMSVVLLMSVFMTIGAFGLKEKEECRGWRRKANRFFCWILSRSIVWAFTGAFFIDVQRPKVCYKKYLGPDWKADYDGKRCGTVISNHGSIIDSLMHAES